MLAEQELSVQLKHGSLPTNNTKKKFQSVGPEGNTLIEPIHLAVLQITLKIFTVSHINLTWPVNKVTLTQSG